MDADVRETVCSNCLGVVCWCWTRNVAPRVSARKLGALTPGGL